MNTRQLTQNLPDAISLGHIAWWTIAQPKATHEDIGDLIDKLGMAPKLKPGKPRLGDAFKRACRYSERKGLPIPGTDNIANFLIRSVTQSSEEVVRHIVVEIVDPDGKRLDYRTTAELTFRRTDETIHVNKMVLISPYSDMADATLQEFFANFDDASKYVDAQVIRRLIRDQLDLANAIAVRRQGSVYFIPVNASDVAHALEEFCRSLNSGSEFVAIPLPDATKYRELVKNAFEEEVHAESLQIIQELNNIRAAGQAIPTGTWNRYNKRLQGLKARLTEYNSLVRFELTKADVEIEKLSQDLKHVIDVGLVKN